MDMHLPDGWLAVGVAAIGNVLLVVWQVAYAVFRLKDHEKRLEKIEVKVEDHASKLNELMSDLRERLARIETILGQRIL